MKLIRFVKEFLKFDRFNPSLASKLHAWWFDKKATARTAWKRAKKSDKQIWSEWADKHGINKPFRSTCVVKQYSDQMVCDSCGLTWDTNDSDPPECKRIE